MLGLTVAALAFGETIVWAAFYYSFPALLLRWGEVEGWGKPFLTASFAGAIILSALTAPLAGRLIDRGRGPLLMTLGAATGAILLLLLAEVESPFHFALVWLGLGVVMAGTLYEPCFALMTRALGKDARRAITHVTLVAGLAGTLAFPLIHVVAEAGDWRLACRTTALLVFFGGLPLLWFGSVRLERQARQDARHTAAPRPSRGASPPSLQGVWKRETFWRLTMGFALLGSVHSLMMNHLLPILDAARLSEAMAVFAAAAVGPMQVVGRLGILGVERHVTSRWIAFSACIAVGLAALCLLGTHFWPVLVILFVLLEGSGYGTISIMRPVMLRESLGDANFGAISGRMARVYTLGVALAPFLGSLIWTVGGYDLVLILMTALAGLALTSFAGISERPWGPSNEPRSPGQEEHSNSS
ncbi:MFS transporter [Jiella marina]|uniref:MFS transporter n=1 Tax=Jiella sp. LLJ827 TaxID=2917712 RepID=UPI00210108EC|nr:MFS transporter [Jiella sp. LLJ827]